MTTLLDIPLFPLGTVLFPDGLLPLRIFEQRYLDMTKNCIRDDARFGVCLIREGNEVGTPALPHETGCIARIIHWDMPHLGLFHLVAQGEQVFRIQSRWTDEQGLQHARVRLSGERRVEPVPAEYRTLVQVLESIMQKVGTQLFPTPARLDDACWVAYRLAEVLPLEAHTRQAMLDCQDPVDTLQTVHAFLQTHSALP